MAAIDEVPVEQKRPGFLPMAAQTYGAQIGVAVFSLGNALVVSRTLGPIGRGDVAFLTAIAFLTSNIFTSGVQEANINLAGTEPRVRRALATNSLILAALLGCIGIAAVAALVIAAPSVGGEVSGPLLALTLASLPMLVLNTYLRFLIQGDYGFGVTNAAWFLPAVINLSVNGSLAIAGLLTVGAAVGTWIAGQAIATAILAWYVVRRSAGFGRPSLALARRTLSFGLKSHVGRIMLLANYRLDMWILGVIAGARELGLYSVAVALAEALFLLPTALSAVQRPDLVRASPEEAVRQASWIFRSSVLLTIFAAVVLVLAAPVLVGFLFGHEFRGAVGDLRVLAGGAFGIVALKQLGSALTARQKPTLASLAIGAAFASTVVLDLVLIPGHGGLGAAAASTFSYTIGGIVVVLIFTRSLGGRAIDLLPRASDVRVIWNRLRTLVSTVRETRAVATTRDPTGGT
jgi:O-antigen/teichoic acid export membrane protein